MTRATSPWCVATNAHPVIQKTSASRLQNIFKEVQVTKSLIERVVIVGFGNIAQALLPLLKQHWPTCDLFALERSVEPEHSWIANQYGIELISRQVSQSNYEKVLSPLIRANSLLLNLATEVSSIDLIRLAQTKGAFYLDTCIDPWEYQQMSHSGLVTNYQLREELREHAKLASNLTTAVAAHGANPGFVSILVKCALNIMRERYLSPLREKPVTRAEWAQLALDLGICVVQISERDAQASSWRRRPDEFVSTWSVDGFVTECLQPAELGWGSHERNFPAKAMTHSYGSKAAIYLNQPSFLTKVKSWSPNQLDFTAYLISHNEAISISDYFSIVSTESVVYRPTCYYAYRPCDEAIESMALLECGSRDAIKKIRVLKEEIVAGIDELGVFLLSGKFPSLWFGSNLSVGKARTMADNNNATSLQVASSILAGMKWIEANPRNGLVESEEMDHELIYEAALPYWSPMVTEFVDWRPCAGKDSLQFTDFLV